VLEEQITVQDYTTKELYELTRKRKSAASFYSKPSAKARKRLQQLDKQITGSTRNERKKKR
jgi:hypothetical protein